MLTLNNICKKFETSFSSTKEVIKNISFSLNQGDFTVMIGSNGAGKSTLLQLILGSIKPNSGSLHIENKDITHLHPHQRSTFIGCVFQDPALNTIAEMTLAENLKLALIRGKSAQLRMHREDEALFIERLQLLDMGLEHRLNDHVVSLSGGQRQALSLIMATLNPPTVLLLDEHCSALDPKTAVTVMKLTHAIINKFSMTALMVTHNLRDAVQYGNRLLMLHHGRLVADFNAEKKKSLSSDTLLNLFHQQEDPELLGEAS
jgi:putative ABC transport system ATP-binding protein